MSQLSDKVNQKTIKFFVNVEKYVFYEQIIFFTFGDDSLSFFVDECSLNTYEDTVNIWEWAVESFVQKEFFK